MGTSLRNAIYEIHTHNTNNTQIEEVVEIFISETGYMGTIVLQTEAGTRLITANGTDHANPPPAPAAPPC